MFLTKKGPCRICILVLVIVFNIMVCSVLIAVSYGAVISKQNVLDVYGIFLFNWRYLFVIVLPNIWSTDGEFTIPEQKQAENNEELASSYERKLIEVKFVLHRFYGFVVVKQGLKLK